MWQPIETAPKDQFLLLCGPSGYTTTPMVVTSGRMCSDYHAGRWIDHANDDLTEWGFEPTHWMPLPDLPDAQPTLSEGSITAGILSGMFLSLDGHDKAQPGYEWRKGWNDAIRQAMDYAQPAPSIPEGIQRVARDFYWDSAALHHVPFVRVEFQPVTANSPNDAKGWQDRDRFFAAMLAAAPEAKP